MYGLEIVVAAFGGVQVLRASTLIIRSAFLEDAAFEGARKLHSPLKLVHDGLAVGTQLDVLLDLVHDGLDHFVVRRFFLEAQHPHLRDDGTDGLGRELNNVASDTLLKSRLQHAFE